MWPLLIPLLTTAAGQIQKQQSKGGGPPSPAGVVPTAGPSRLDADIYRRAKERQMAALRARLALEEEE